MVSDSIFRHLSNDAGVSALVASRIYPMVIPQQSYDEATKQPCLVYGFDTDERQPLFEGSSKIVRGRLQIDCYSRSYATLQRVAEAVRDSLIDFSGSMSANTSPISSVNVRHIFLEGETALLDEEPGLYRVLQRYVVWYDESTPS